MAGCKHGTRSATCVRVSWGGKPIGAMKVKANLGMLVAHLFLQFKLFCG